MEQTIKLELTVEQINQVLGSLGQMPFAQVAGLIGEIRQQAAPQVTQPESPAEVPEVPEG